VEIQVIGNIPKRAPSEGQDAPFVRQTYILLTAGNRQSPPLYQHLFHNVFIFIIETMSVCALRNSHYKTILCSIIGFMKQVLFSSDTMSFYE